MAELMRYVQREENQRMYFGPRYEAAYQQVNTRIAARENILIGYVAAAATLNRTLALFVIVGGSSTVAVLIGRDVAVGNVVVWYTDIVATLVAIFCVLQPRIRRLQQYRRWIAMQR